MVVYRDMKCWVSTRFLLRPEMTNASRRTAENRTPRSHHRAGLLRCRWGSGCYGPETMVTVSVVLYDPAAASAGTTNCVVKVSVLFPIPFVAAELNTFPAAVGIAS